MGKTLLRETQRRVQHFLQEYETLQWVRRGKGTAASDGPRERQRCSSRVQEKESAQEQTYRPMAILPKERSRRAHRAGKMCSRRDSTSGGYLELFQAHWTHASTGFRARMIHIKRDMEHERLLSKSRSFLKPAFVTRATSSSSYHFTSLKSPIHLPSTPFSLYPTQQLST